jgi:zinc protease
MERLGGFGGKADILAENETFGGSPDYYKKVQSWIKAATPADIKRTAAQWLSDGEYVLQILPYKNFSNTKSDLDRSKMPELSKASPATFPPVKQFTLNNGLKVALAERHSEPLVSMSAIVGAGYAADQSAQQGTATLTGTMLIEGTQSRTALQISDALQNAGADISINSQLDNTFVNMTTLSNNFDSSLNLFADILLHPSFPQGNFDRVKKEQLIAIHQEEADPFGAVQRVVNGLIFPKDHAYNTPATGTGTTASVQNINRQMLLQFHKVWFVPNNTLIVVAGDITVNELKAKLEKYFAAWKNGDVPKKNIADVPLVSASAVYVIDKPGATQSMICAAGIAPSATSNNYDNIMMMNRIFGGQFTSRLNMNLREDKHWSYGAGSFLRNAEGPSTYILYAPVQTDKTKESLAELKKELSGITSDRPITDTELQQTQAGAMAELSGLWETNREVRNFLGDALIYNRGIDYLNNYYSTLQHMTAADMKTAVATVVKPQNLTWIIVGDRAKIAKDVEGSNLGTVHYIDPEGQEAK